MNPKGRSNDYFLVLLGYLTLGILVVLSLLFYRERMLILDNAFQTFLMINDDRIEIMVHRYPAALIRILPYLLFKCGASLKVILMAFSASYTLFTLLAFHIIVRYFRRPQLALALVLVFTLMVSDTFYWCPSELLQGIPFCFIITAFVFNKKTTGFGFWMILFSLMVICSLYHPLVIFPMLFLIFYYFESLGWKKAGLISVLFTNIHLIKSLTLRNFYDNEKVNSLWANINEYGINLASIPRNKIFLDEIFHHYYFLVIAMVVVIYWFTTKKKYFHLLLCAISTVAFTILLHYSFPESPHKFYMESSYLILGVFWFVPMLHIAWKNGNQLIPKIIFSAAIVISLVRIYYTHGEYKARHDYLLNAMAQSRYPKTYIKESKENLDVLEMTWGASFESLILSSLYHKSPQTVWIDKDPESNPVIKESRRGVFLGGFGEIKASRLNKYYFPLADSTYRRSF